MLGIFKKKSSFLGPQSRLSNGIGLHARSDATSAITCFAFLIALTVLVVIVAVKIIDRSSADSPTTVAGQISRIGGAANGGGQ